MAGLLGGNGNGGGGGIAMKVMFAVVMLLVGSMVTTWVDSVTDDPALRSIDALAEEFDDFKDTVLDRLARLETRQQEIQRQLLRGGQ